eukprot:6419193-Amphidinium_carterae.1
MEGLTAWATSFSDHCVWRITLLQGPHRLVREQVGSIFGPRVGMHLGRCIPCPLQPEKLQQQLNNRTSLMGESQADH